MSHTQHSPVIETSGFTLTHFSPQAAEPFFSALFSYLFMGDVAPIPVLLTLVPIVAGVIIPSISEVSFNWGGFLAAVASNITFQSRNVLSKKLMISSVSSNMAIQCG